MSTCKLASGASSAEGATATAQSAAEFRKALLYFEAVRTRRALMLPKGVNFEGFCVELYLRLDSGGVCQQTFHLAIKGERVARVVLVDCKNKSELYVVLQLCAEPCMSDIKNTCCFVPTEIALLFPCCR